MIGFLIVLQVITDVKMVCVIVGGVHRGWKWRTQFGLTLQVEQDVASFDVTVDLSLEVEILETPQGILEVRGNLLLL